jgi:hypothetical protein
MGNKDVEELTGTTTAVRHEVCCVLGSHLVFDGDWMGKAEDD